MAGLKWKKTEEGSSYGELIRYDSWIAVTFPYVNVYSRIATFGMGVAGSNYFGVMEMCSSTDPNGSYDRIFSVPLVTLSSNLVFEGEGTQSNPWTFREYTPEDFSGKPLIMEWSVPSELGNQGVKLPIEANEKNFFIVNWGDSDTWELFTGTANFPSHVYDSKYHGYHRITIYGSVYSFGYSRPEVPTESNAYKDYYTYTQCLMELVQWGELGVEGTYISPSNPENRPSYGFSNCFNFYRRDNLLPSPDERTFENAITAEGMFRNNWGFYEYNDLFTGGNRIQSFESTFQGCRLEAPIRNSLFANCRQVQNFKNTFRDCTELPGGEIDIETDNVVTLEGMFEGCTKAEILIFNGDYQNLAGKDMFAGDDTLKAIALLYLPNSQSDITNYFPIATEAQIPSYTKIYVADSTVEKYYEEAWRDVLGTTTTDKIHTIVEPIGDNPVYLAIKEKYNDEGYTILGYPLTEKEKYEPYGLFAITDGLPVDTETAGEKEVTYSLFHEDKIAFYIQNDINDNTDVSQYVEDVGITWKEFCEKHADLYEADGSTVFPLENNNHNFNVRDARPDETIIDGYVYLLEEYGAACVRGTTAILTSIDENTILAKDIQEGDSIVYYDFEKNQLAEGTVSRVYIHKDAISFVTYTFTDGTKLEVTDYHPIYTKTGWKSYTRHKGYEVPKIGDHVKTPEGWKILGNIETFTGLEDYYDFAIVDTNGNAIDNYFGNGTLVQNSILPEANLKAQP